jgi:hypothetical protein
MAKHKNKKTDPNTTAARGYSQEKYGPAIAEVNRAFGAAKDQFGSDIDAADAAADSGKANALATLPSVQKSYSDALGKADSDNSFINAELAKLGSAADVFKGASTKSQGAFHDRIIGAGANAEQSLRDRSTAAEAGRQFAKNQARADYRKTTGSLRQQLVDLQSQAGAAAANKLSDLLQADLDRENRRSIATIGADATTGAATIRANAQADKDAADKKKSHKDVYGNTIDQRRSRRSTFKNAVTLGSSINPRGDKSEDQVYKLLLVQNPSINNTIARAAANASVNSGEVSDVALRKALRRMGIMVTAPTPAVTGGQRDQAASNTPGQQRPT